jgi:hypothetical protein
MDRLRLNGAVGFAFGSLVCVCSPSAHWPSYIRLRLIGVRLFAFGSLAFIFAFGSLVYVLFASAHWPSYIRLRLIGKCFIRLRLALI